MLREIRSAITEKTVDILAGYRKNFSGSHPPGQLVLPENLKEFGMYMLGLIKCRAYKGKLSSQIPRMTYPLIDAPQAATNQQTAESMICG